MDITDSVKDGALWGLKFAAEKEHLSLYAVRPEWIAEVVAAHALTAAINTGQVVESSHHAAALEKLRRRASQFESRWASEMVRAEHQLRRVQSALSEIDDQDLAAVLAEKIGVILPEEEAT